MIAPNPLDDAVARLADATVPADIISLAVPDAPALPEEPGERRFLLYVGLYDLLAEASLKAAATDAERERILAHAFAGAMSAESVLRFARHERSTRAENLEMTTRMRGKEIGMTDRWLVPRLERDIAAYQARIDALRRVIEDRPPVTLPSPERLARRRSTLARKAASVAIHRFELVTNRERFARAEHDEQASYERHLELHKDIVPPLKLEAKGLRSEVRQLEEEARELGIDVDAVEPRIDWPETMAVENYEH